MKVIFYTGMVVIIILLVFFVVSLVFPMIPADNITTSDEINFVDSYDHYYNSEISDYEQHYFCKDYSTFDNIELNRIPNVNVLMQRLLNPINSSWPMYCHDVRHTGRSPYNTTDNYGVEQWRFWTDYGIESSPAIGDDGVIYFGSLDDYLYALYPNGTEKWRFDCVDWVSSSPALSDDGTIYIGSWDAHLYAVNPDGTEKWRFYTYDTVISSPAISEDGIIYFGVLGPGNNIGRLYALYPNGTEKWHFDTAAWIYKSPAIGVDGIIYISSEDNHLYALYPNNGSLKWSFVFGGWPSSPSIGDNGTIYIASDDGYLYAVNPNGTQNWRHYIDWGSGQTPAIAIDGTIYIGYKYLYAINPNGTRKWTFNCGGNYLHVTTSVAISNEGTVYFGATEGTNRGDIIAVYQNGTEKWRRTIADDWVDSSPAINNDGTIYIGSSSRNQGWSYGYLYAFHIGELEVDANGPYYGLINQSVQFVGSATGGSRPYSWFWDFGDGQSSEEQNPAHTYIYSGNFTVTLTVTDNNGNTSNNTTWAKIKETNNPPDKPSITGPKRIRVDHTHNFNFNTTDIDNDEGVYYYIDWGDNSNSGWIGPYELGKEITKTHKWSKIGTYTISCKAKDVYNFESERTTFKIFITFSRNRVLYNSFFMRFLERFPLFQKLLNFSL